MERARERALLESVVEQMPIGVVIFDPDGTTLVSNRAYERIFGRQPPSNVLDGDHPKVLRRDGSVVATDDMPAIRARRSGTSADGDFAFERADGDRLMLRVWAEPVLDDDGTLTAVTVMIEDVTPRQRRERAEREFVVNAAHELQSPIAAVLAAAEALERGAKDDERDRDRFIGHITHACRRLARLTHALLVLARTEVGAEAPKREVVPLAPLLSSVAAGTSVAAGVELRVVCPEDAAALAHPELLEQAVANLLANAAKHTQSGRISVAATVDGMAEIAVDDTGSGIAPDDQERVKRRFVRVGDDRDGFGLGLAIVDQAVRAMEGQLRIESQLGRGTKATIVLPSARLISG
jgi:PAS domain S-box-containing protein